MGVRERVRFSFSVSANIKLIRLSYNHGHEQAPMNHATAGGTMGAGGGTSARYGGGMAEGAGDEVVEWAHDRVVKRPKEWVQDMVVQQT